MADSAAKHANYVARLVNRTASLLDALDALKGLRAEWDESGYGSGGTAIVDADLGQFPALTAADLGSAMSTIDALATLRSQGHGTNLQRLRP